MTPAQTLARRIQWHNIAVKKLTFKMDTNPNPKTREALHQVQSKMTNLILELKITLQDELLREKQ